MDHPTWSLPVHGGAIGGITLDGDGPSVLLVPNVGACASTWTGVMGCLPGFRTVALDLRGHGRSFTAPLLTSNDSWRDLVTVIEGLELGATVVVGHTTGGFLALAAAADRPDLISAVVTVEAALPIGSRPEVHAFLTETYTDEVLEAIAQRYGFGHVFGSRTEVEDAAAALSAAVQRDWLINESVDGFAEDFRDAVQERGDGSWVMTPTVAAMRAAHTIDIDARYFPHTQLYQQMTAPIHIVQAGDGISVFTPEQVRLLEEELPHVRVHDLDGGHMVHRSNAVRFAQIIAAAAGETAAGETAAGEMAPTDVTAAAP